MPIGKHRWNAGVRKSAFVFIKEKNIYLSIISREIHQRMPNLEEHSDEEQGICMVLSSPHKLLISYEMVEEGMGQR